MYIQFVIYKNSGIMQLKFELHIINRIEIS